MKHILFGFSNFYRGEYGYIYTLVEINTNIHETLTTLTPFTQFPMKSTNPLQILIGIHYIQL